MVKKSKTKKRTAVRVAKKAAPTPAKKEVSMLGGILRNLGGLGGRMAGNLIGMGDTGANVGTGLGASLSRWLGSGDYAVTKNSLVSQFKGSGNIPMMHKTGQSIIVRHKEYITDVYSGTGTPSVFNVFNTFALNPGLSTSFPWLSGIAQQYQEYTWRGIVYEYISTSGQSVASTNTALGSVMIATNYRATAASYPNKQVMLNEFFSSDAKPSNDFCHPIECNPRENPYNVQYVRGGAVPAGEDQKTYDLGVTSIATEGLPSAGIDCGELWVSYEVELRKPILSVATDVFAKTAHYGSTTSVAAATPFGTSQTSFYDHIGLVITSTSITFPLGSVGRYFVCYSAGSAVTVSSFAGMWGTTTNCSEVMDEAAQIAHSINSNYTAASSPAQAISCAIINIPDNTLQAVLGGTATTLTGVNLMDLFVMQIGQSDV